MADSMPDIHYDDDKAFIDVVYGLNVTVRVTAANCDRQILEEFFKRGIKVTLETLDNSD
jgi:hypothetical protein